MILILALFKTVKKLETTWLYFNKGLVKQIEAWNIMKYYVAMK